jgi:hypothetical protein
MRKQGRPGRAHRPDLFALPDHLSDPDAGAALSDMPKDAELAIQMIDDDVVSGR